MEKSNKRLTKEFIKNIETLLEKGWCFADQFSHWNFYNLKNMKNGVVDYNVTLFKNTYFFSYIEVECKTTNLEQIVIYKDEK